MQTIIPPVLNEFKNELEYYKLDTIKITALPIEDGEILEIKRSKFLGNPYLPLQFEYPKDKNDKPLILIAQLNFSEIPTLQNYPDSGILQFYISATDWYDMTDYRVIYHENTSIDHQTDFSFLTDDLYEETPIFCEHRLQFNKNSEYGGSEDFRFDIKLNGKDLYDYCETLSKEEADQVESLFDASGHKISGYAYFTQSDPRDNKMSNLSEDLLLLQIDTDEQIMFGDCGVANFFIHPDDLINKRFDKAWFNWDCC
ncbi:YwqG family protein [Sphingobacterium kitahiroshimense]|uniref:YwqG family protein n=1 Tax=Sphingobacterium kitahiroshimense TaxID=470446 RepID=UPI00320A3011